METERIKEILQVYRPGEGLESDPEVKQALEQASRDPQLEDLRRQTEAFDAAFADKLSSVEVPDSLYTAILEKAQSSRKKEPSPAPENRKVIQWRHPVAFGLAASIFILLTLSFTFLRNSDPETSDLATASTVGLMPTANALYASLNPTYESSNGQDILNYLNRHDGTIPDSFPRGFAWDHSFACDILNVNGKTVSLICFHPKDNSGRLHLFTFKREDFPGELFSKVPEIHTGETDANAIWADADQIHVLYSEEGEANLRRVLDI